MSVTWAQREGAVVDGQFQLGTYIGGSDRSAVFRTRAGDHEAAIKLIPANSGNAESQIARWKLAVHLSHPHLVRMLRTGRCQVGGSPMLYAVMELADENLAEILAERALRPEEVREMLEPVLDALSYLHRRGFAHGRLKPANIMASADKLKVSSDGLLPLGEMTSQRERPGAYDPPEMGTKANTPAGDIWSLGMTLVETLTQRLPARDSKTQEDLAVPETMPAPFREVARRALRWDPAARCTISEIRELLKPGSPAYAAPVLVAPVQQKQPPKQKPKPAAKPPATQAKQSAEAQRYVVLAIVAALIIAAVLIAPRLFSHRETNSTATQTATTEALAPSTGTPPPAAAPVSAQPEVSHEAPKAKPAPPAAAQPAPKPAKTEAAPSATVSAPARAAAPPPESKPKEQPRASSPANADVLNQVMPAVSQKARDTIQGKVRVSVKVSVDSAGAVTDATLKSPGPSHYFADRAIEAARQWKFAPASAAGDWILQFDFHRSDTKVLPTRVAP